MRCGAANGTARWLSEREGMMPEGEPPDAHAARLGHSHFFRSQERKSKYPTGNEAKRAREVPARYARCYDSE